MDACLFATRLQPLQHALDHICLGHPFRGVVVWREPSLGVDDSVLFQPFDVRPPYLPNRLLSLHQTKDGVEAIDYLTEECVVSLALHETEEGVRVSKDVPSACLHFPVIFASYPGEFAKRD